jgi:hypothetical protein
MGMDNDLPCTWTPLSLSISLRTLALAGCKFQTSILPIEEYRQKFIIQGFSYYFILFPGEKNGFFIKKNPLIVISEVIV